MLNKILEFVGKVAIAPTIVQRYMQDRKEGAKLLKQYVEHVKNNNLKEALATFDIEINEEGFKKLAQVASRQEQFFYEEERE